MYLVTYKRRAQGPPLTLVSSIASEPILFDLTATPPSRQLKFMHIPPFMNRPPWENLALPTETHPPNRRCLSIASYRHPLLIFPFHSDM